MIAAVDTDHLHELLGKALRASLLAGDALMDVYGTAFEIEYKGDQSPVTEADRKSHGILASNLGGEIPLLSEEGSRIPYEMRKDFGCFWLIDPLDGTKEFIKRNGEFTVNIALIEKTQPMAGIVYLPAKRELFWGARGIGAFRIGAAELESLRESKADCILTSAQALAVSLPEGHSDREGKVRVVQSISHVIQEESNFMVQLNSEMGGVESVSAGSSLKFCRIAEGSADIYPRFGPTMEWDTAAGQCIAESAGAEVLDIAGLLPICYNRPVLRNEAFIVLGSRIRSRISWRDLVLECARKSLKPSA